MGVGIVLSDTTDFIVDLRAHQTRSVLRERLPGKWYIYVQSLLDGKR